MKYVKVAKQAESFYDSRTGLFLRKGQVTKLTSEQAASAKVVNALKGGHLDHSNEEEFKEWLESQPAVEEEKAIAPKTSKPAKVEEEDDNPLYADIPTELGRDKIAKWIKDTYELEDSDITALDAMKSKKEVIEFAKNIIDEVEGEGDAE